MLTPGNILRIPDFEFEDGGSPRDKYLIVIAVAEELSLLLRVLTTSQLKVPKDKMMHGCRNEPENGLHFFMFEKERMIGSIDYKDFAFPKHTFILFRNNIKDVPIEPFMLKYKDKTEIACVLTEGELQRLKKCIKQNQRMADRSARRNFSDIFGF